MLLSGDLALLGIIKCWKRVCDCSLGMREGEDAGRDEEGDASPADISLRPLTPSLLPLPSLYSLLSLLSSSSSSINLGAMQQ